MRLLTFFLAGVVVLGAIACGGDSGNDGSTATAPATADGSLQTISAQLDRSSAVEFQLTSEWSTALIPLGLVIAERSVDLDPDEVPSGPRLLIGDSGDPIDGALALFPPGISESDAAARLEVLDGPSVMRVGAGDHEAVVVTTRQMSDGADVTRRYLTVFHDSAAHLIVLEAPSSGWEAAAVRLEALVAEPMRFVASSAGGAGARPSPTATSGLPARPAEIPAGWSLDLLETFDQATRWYEGTRDDAVATTRAEFVDGAYRLAVEAESGVLRQELLVIAVEPVLAISTESVRTSEAADCGVLLRYESGWFLFFLINDVGQRFVAVASQGEDLVFVVPDGFDPIVRSNATNRLTVIAEGERIRVFVNGQLLGDVSDERFGPVSNVGLVVGNPAEGGSSACEFDDLEIYVP